MTTFTVSLPPERHVDDPVAPSDDINALAAAIAELRAAGFASLADLLVALFPAGHSGQALVSGADTAGTPALVPVMTQQQVEQAIADGAGGGVTAWGNVIDVPADLAVGQWVAPHVTNIEHKANGAYFIPVVFTNAKRLKITCQPFAAGTVTGKLGFGLWANATGHRRPTGTALLGQTWTALNAAGPAPVTTGTIDVVGNVTYWFGFWQDTGDATDGTASGQFLYTTNALVSTGPVDDTSQYGSGQPYVTDLFYRPDQFPNFSEATDLTGATATTREGLASVWAPIFVASA